MSEPENDPVPDPFVVKKSDNVGEEDVLQHTPLAVTGEPPSLVIEPWPVAVVEVIASTAEVVTIAMLALVVKESSFP